MSAAQRALERLHQINRLCLSDGRRLSALITVDGFEPWWFVQDYLLWQVIAKSSKRSSLSLLTIARNIVLFFVSLWTIFRYTKRSPILLYSVDTGSEIDPRLGEVIAEVSQEPAQLVKIHHVLSAKQSLCHLPSRNNSLYFEPLVSALRPFLRLQHPMPSVGDSESLYEECKQGLIAAYQASLTYRACKLVLSVLKPRSLLCLDDSRHAYPLVAAAKHLGIKTIGLQHGLNLNEYFPGHTCIGFSAKRSHAYDDYLFWSDYFRNRFLPLSEIYSESNTHVSGALRSLPAQSSVNRARETVRVLAIEESELPSREFTPYQDALNVDPRIKLSIRQRSDNEYQSLSDALSDADVVIGAYSSVLYEAIAALRPVIVIPSKHHLSAAHLAAENLADLFLSPSSATDTVLRAALIHRTVLEQRRRIVWGDTQLDGLAYVVKVSG